MTQVKKVWYETMNNGMIYDEEFVCQPLVHVFRVLSSISVESMIEKLEVLSNVSVFEISGDVYVESELVLDETGLSVFFEQLEDVLVTF